MALAIAAFVLVSQRGGDDASGAVGTGVELSVLRTADFHSMAVSPRDANLILYGHHGGVLRSNDGGRSWTETNFSGKTDDATGMGFTGAGGNVVLQRWQSRPLPSAGAVMVTAINPLDAMDIAVVVAGDDGTGRVHRSADGGATWTAR